MRSELINAGLISILATVIENKSHSIATPATIALAAILQEEEARILLLKSNGKIFEKLVENVISPLEDLCRNSIIALGNACKTDSICKIASQVNAIDNLLQAINDPAKNLSHIAKSTLLKVIEQSILSYPT